MQVQNQYIFKELLDSKSFKPKIDLLIGQQAYKLISFSLGLNKKNICY
jgi:hypothetical protein